MLNISGEKNIDGRTCCQDGGLEVGDNLVAIIEVQGSKRANHLLGLMRSWQFRGSSAELETSLPWIRAAWSCGGMLSIVICPAAACND